VAPIQTAPFIGRAPGHHVFGEVSEGVDKGLHSRVKMPTEIAGSFRPALPRNRPGTRVA